MPKPRCAPPYRQDVTRIEEPEPVHREEDGELVGHLTVRRRDGADVWVARALFGSPLREFPDREAALAFLRRSGLPLLAERWWYRPAGDAEAWLTFLVEARPDSVRVRFGHDPEATAILSGEDLDRLSLHRAP